MPICSKCNTNNNIERKTCKKCGQAIIREEGSACSFCRTINGPFAKMCRNCGKNLNKVTNNYSKNSNQDNNNSDNSELKKFYELLKSSYLYNSQNNTFAEENFTLHVSGGVFTFTIRNFCFSFKKPSELIDIFNMNIHSIPDFIKEKASKLIRPIFEKYNLGSNVKLLDTTFGYENVMLAFANEKGQLAATMNLPIYEYEIEPLLQELSEFCNTSNRYISMYDNELFGMFLETMDYHYYRYEFIKGNGKEFIYKIGDKTVTIRVSEDSESLKINHLNKNLTLTKSDKEFISVIFSNWMFNNVIDSMTIGERMKQFFNETTGVLQKMKGFLNKNNYTTHYSLTEHDNLILNILSENIIKFSFKELNATVIEPIPPNMPYEDFNFLLERYIGLSKNEGLIQFLKKIESSTKNKIFIEDVSASSCKVFVETPKNTILTSMVLNKDTTFIEITKFINKINFLEQFIESK